jgi:hypothetical protein
MILLENRQALQIFRAARELVWGSLRSGILMVNLELNAVTILV